MSTKHTAESFILRSDAAAAKHVTDISGWVSRNGRFFGDGPHGEEMARYDGCTHVSCDKCGEPTPKGWLRCETCRDKAEVERHAGRKTKPWDGKCMIYSEAADKWFNDLEEIIEYSGEHNASFESLLLVLSEPVYARTIDPTEHYVDDLPSDDPDESYIPKDILDAFEALNKVIEACKTPLSWQPSVYALDLRFEDEGRGLA